VQLVSLSEAREKALENRKAARAGENPLANKRASEAILSFSEAAKRVHAMHMPTWRNPKHAAQWINTLETYAFPTIGAKRITDVTSADVLAVLSPIWTQKPETAQRVRQRIGAVLKWAMAQGWRSDNPCETITNVLPKASAAQKRHMPALPYTEVASAIAAIQASQASMAAKLAFEFLVLTACRSGEVRGAMWEEIDLQKAVWSIPASRMKAKKPHNVPLSKRAIDVLQQASALSDGETGLVFPSPISGKQLSDMTLSKLLKEQNIAAVPHGFRSSFRDWAGEQTNIPREVAEFCLAHVTKDKTEAAYARSDLFEKRRKLMEAWNNYVKV
jgi:integrase